MDLDIDLRSDTVTQPSDEMREAAATADVGDDVYRDDPTVNELERRAAEAVGKEAALYVPTGTMGNQIAVRVHTERGNELLCDIESHMYKLEKGGVAQLSGVQTRPIDFGDKAVPKPEAIRAGFSEQSLHRPGTGLLTLENTGNIRGGVAVPKSDLDPAIDAAHDLGIPVHLDGARLFNAAVALDTSAEELADRADSVLFCLSKGLGAPVGSVLAGPTKFVDEARQVRKLLGGGMRQAGIIAAPGLEALGNVERLAEDHENAAVLAAGLADISGLSVQEPDTNILMVDSEAAGIRAEELVERYAAIGIHVNPVGEYRTRYTTHWNVDRSDIETVVDRTADVVGE